MEEDRPAEIKHGDDEDDDAGLCSVWVWGGGGGGRGAEAGLGCEKLWSDRKIHTNMLTEDGVHTQNTYSNHQTPSVKHTRLINQDIEH